MSSGFRLVTSLPSATISLSTQFAATAQPGGWKWERRKPKGGKAASISCLQAWESSKGLQLFFPSFFLEEFRWPFPLHVM